MSVVLISTGRSKEVPHASKALIERSLGSASTSSLLIVLGSSIVNIVNLFTGDQGALIAGHATQNPFSLGCQTLLLELHPLKPTGLQSTPPVAPW